MIFYFSATGNCKDVASKLARSLNDEIVSISDCINNDKFVFSVKNNEKIGLVTPTYFLGLPNIVIEFLKKLTLDGYDKNYIYSVSTYGTSPGQPNRFIEEILKEKGKQLNASYSVKTVDVWTPIFDLTNKEKNTRILKNSDIEINEVIKFVQNEKKGDYVKAKLPLFIVKLWRKNYEKARLTKNFWVEDTCISCGICERKCPIKAIQITDGKPKWIKEKCTLCLGCLHRCPKFSIQYGKNTKKHGQYLNPNVKV